MFLVLSAADQEVSKDIWLKLLFYHSRIEEILLKINLSQNVKKNVIRAENSYVSAVDFFSGLPQTSLKSSKTLI